jgi:hypothetical protein
VFDYLLGIEKVNQIVWDYLNTGTHEEEGRSEFDHTLVREIAAKMDTLDKLVKECYPRMLAGKERTDIRRS